MSGGGKSKKVTVGYRYYMGGHMVPCLGPIDSVERIDVGDREVSFRGPADVMLVIDSSGSMSTEDPSYLRVSAGKRFVDEMNNLTRAGVVDFNSSATLLQGLTSNRDDLKSALDDIGASGGTSLASGVSTALSHMNGSARPEARRFVILLTDGAGSWSTGLESDANSTGTVIYTVGLGGGVDGSLLQSIANNTGGEYYKANQPSDIDPIFQAILRLVSTIAESGMYSALVSGSALTPPGWIRAQARSPELFGGESREGGIEGPVDIGLGFPTQPRNDYLQTHLGDDVPAYRGLVSLVLRQVFVGLNPYLKPWKARLRRIYTRAYGEPQWYWEKAGWPVGHHAHGDMNPIHAIREALTEPWGARLPESEIGPSYAAAADQIHDEGLGISLLWTDDTAPKSLVDELIRHIDAIRYENPETGLQEIALIRGDYDVETLPVLNPSNCEITNRSTVQVSETTNQITVTYWNRATGKDTPLTVQDTAAITMSGRIRAATLEYPAFSHAETALQAAERDLAQMARPFERFEITATRRAPQLRPGDLFLLNSPDDGIASIVCRVAKRGERGLTNGSVVLEAAEDVFGSAFSTYTVPPESGWVDPVGEPRNVADATALEIPYPLLVQALGEDEVALLPSDAGYYAYAGVRPSGGTHINYGLFAAAEGETLVAEDVEVADFTPVATVNSVLDDPSETSIPVSALPDLDLLRAGQLVLVGDASDAEREIVALEAVPVEGDSAIEVLRGVADTVPRPIAAGTRLWFIEAMAGESESRYTEGERVSGHGRPRNGRGEFTAPQDGSDPYIEREVEMAARQFRPYPPANLQLDGHYDGAYSGQFTSPGILTWAHRDRVTQSDHAMGWFDGDDVGPEPDTTYRLEVYGVDSTGNVSATPIVDEDLGLVASYEFDTSINPVPGDATSIQFRLWSVRDGYDSLQHPTYTVPILLAPVMIDVLAIEAEELLAPVIIDVVEG